MRLLFQITFAGFVALLALGVFIGLGVYSLALRSLPDYNAEFAVDGIEQPISILRDAANVPHISAKNDHDAMFALGYVHAQDRLWQMILQRRTAQGRLSEIFGIESLPLDRLMRSVDLYGRARRSVAAQSPKAQALLAAYAAGVNARLTQINLNAEGRGAPELFLFSNPVAPWRPLDSLALLKLRAFVNTDHIRQELHHGRMALALDDDQRVEDLFATDPVTREDSSLQINKASFNSQGSVFPNDIRASHRSLDYSMFRDAGASNVFAVSSERSAKGASLLAHDPHGALRAPGPYYLAHLTLSTGGVIGATQPGIPAVLFGRNEHFAWGVTSSFVDDSDILMVPQSDLAGFEKRRSIIKIKDHTSDDQNYYYSALSGVLPPAFLNVQQLTPKGHVAVLKSTILNDQDTTFTGLLNVMMANSPRGAHEASMQILAPSTNYALVDRNDAYFFTAGALPIRDRRHASQGRWPSLAVRTENLWQGTKPAAALQDFDQTKRSVVINTNNRLTDAPFPQHLSHHWGDAQRIRRLKSIMQSRSIHTRESFVELQQDTVSYAARALLPLVARDLWYANVSPSQGENATLRQEALTRLAQWEGKMDQHNAEPLIFTAWMNVLQRNLIRDELGKETAFFDRYNPLFIERVFRDISGAGIWCDIKPTIVVESCAEIAKTTLDEALALISKSQGSNIETWRWGQAHVAVHDNTTMGRFPFLNWLATIEQPISGGDHTLNMAKSRGGFSSFDFGVNYGATYRGVYDMSDPDSSVFIISTGQSGHILSRHYDDQSARWRRGEYIPMSMDLELAKGGSVGRTTILPIKAE